MQGVLGGAVGYEILRRVGGQSGPWYCSGASYQNRSKLETLLGPDVFATCAGRVVLDFGCGTGQEAIELARAGASRVLGVDINQRHLADARESAKQAGLGDRCWFGTEPDVQADVIISVDAFEHYDAPAEVLRAMRRQLAPSGRVLVAFGPPWFHPYGGHMFSVFPWAHLLFTESALIRWRSDFHTDGATRFSEVDGGLNQMSVKAFEQLIAASEFRIERFEAVPMRRLRWIAGRATREFTTANVRCTLAAKRD